MNVLKRFIYENIIPLTGYLFKNKNKFINVIYYHDIVKGKGDSFMRTNIDLFKKQMQYLVRHRYETLRFEDLNDKNIKFNKKSILICFDDGWLSNYTEIFHFMKEHKLKYNIFLTIKEIGNNSEYLNWDLVRKMHNEGIVGFGIHTYNHSNLKDISKIDPEIEFHTADRIFKHELGFSPKDFCYPFGSYSNKTNQYLLDHTNYLRIYTSELMYSYDKNNKIVFGRNGISNNESMEIFKNKVKGNYNIFKSLYHLLNAKR